MTKRQFLSSLRFFRPLQHFRTEKIAQGWAESRCQSRKWEEMYHRRWEHDKVARSTHGVNCTGGCSWHVYVKDGIIVWETQALDYPHSGTDTPNYEPRGCNRGATFSWYIYSPLRVKYPYMRSTLLELWQEALAAHPDPVTAWGSIMADPDKTKKYREVRGKGGLVRVSWDQAATVIAAALVHTIKKYGPDRIFGFTPIPAMSMVCYASGARFLSLIGGSLLSFYDWYSDWPAASPQMWGEKTDVPESADWYQSSYVICAGNNINQTRTPDAHFYSELRYRGGKVVAVSPDYAEYVKFADTWLPAKAGTDGALAMAMTHVILKEFYLDRQVPYFLDYAKKYTDLPFAVILKKDGDHYISDRFLRAPDLGLELANGEWKTVFFDTKTKAFVVPPGSIGFRWGEEPQWNLKLQDAASGAAVEPALSFAAEGENIGWVAVKFPRFDFSGPSQSIGMVPVKHISRGGQEILVATVFDLFLAHVGLERGHGLGARDYDGPIPFTPAWQESITGVPRGEVIRVAREFAENAEKTKGKSMILLGSGTNHWFNSDMLYRAYLNLTTLCGCQGVNGGGWAHYTGQEKVRMESGWATLAFALDWLRPPRQQNGTSFFYFATDQWRYEKLSPVALAAPWYAGKVEKHPADCNIIAARLGWLPFYPQFDRSPLELCREARCHGAYNEAEIAVYVVNLLKVGALRFAAEDPDNLMNRPRIMFFWRANVLGASNRGHEYFLRHLLGADDAVLDEENEAMRPQEMRVREADPQGKLDLLVTLELRMNTSAIYSDIVLPAATWYEFDDLNTTDLHPFIHPFTPAVDPLFESRTNWEQFKTIAQKFSELAATHLGLQEDLVATPLNHDTPFEIAQPFGRVKDWKKGETEPIPGKTMPRLKVVKRDFPNTYKMMTALGPLVKGDEGVEGKSVSWEAAEEYEELKELLGEVTETGITQGMPRVLTQKDASEVILALSPESNGRVAVKGWRHLEKITGLDLVPLAAGLEGERYTFEEVVARPRREIMSPIWTGVHSDKRTYTAFSLNIEHLVPFRTLTGRAQFYQDHEWMLAYGEALPLFRPPIDYQGLGYTDTQVPSQPGKELILNYLTPHAKWSIHTTYHDNLIMMTLFRGGAVLWLNHEDAARVGIEDNDWVEMFNLNGVMLARAAVSHRIPQDKCILYHAYERTMNVPLSRITGKRGGMINSLTRIFMKPTHMIGAYAQQSFGFNYYGPTGAERDAMIVVRKAGEVSYGEK